MIKTHKDLYNPEKSKHQQEKTKRVGTELISRLIQKGYQVDDFRENGGRRGFAVKSPEGRTWLFYNYDHLIEYYSSITGEAK